MNVGDKEIKVQGHIVRIARVADEGFQFVANPESVLEGLQRALVRIDLFTFVQRLPETSPKYGYPMEWDNVAALPITTFDHWWTEQIGFKARNKAKQSHKKGVSVREVGFDDALVRGIQGIYNECPVRQGRLFPHYGKDLETVRKMSATFLESSIFIGAYLGEKLIGFVKLTVDEARSQAATMHILAMVQHRDKAPTNALIAQAVRSCAERGIPYLVYSKFAYGKKRQDSLSDFKKSNGFQRIDVPRYYLPLTSIGHIALRLGLHHRVLDYFPESVIARFRELRSAWYNRRFQSAPESS